MLDKNYTVAVLTGANNWRVSSCYNCSARSLWTNAKKLVTKITQLKNNRMWLTGGEKKDKTGKRSRLSWWNKQLNTMWKTAGLYEEIMVQLVPLKEGPKPSTDWKGFWVRKCLQMEDWNTELPWQFWLWGFFFQQKSPAVDMVDLLFLQTPG